MITGLIDGTIESASPAAADFSAPHPAEGGPLGSGKGGNDVIPADDERTSDAKTVSCEVLELCSHQPQNDVGNGQRLLLCQSAFKFAPVLEWAPRGGQVGFQ